jgi:GNAT superfamily N-acetyltransferase
VIRRARQEETSLLSDLALRSKAHWGYSEEFMELCRDELCISASYLEQHASFVLEADRQVVGFATLEHLTASRVELGHLFVDPASIGFGFGRTLVAHVIEEARQRGYRIMEIQADPHAEAFYTATGARRIGVKESASVPGRELPLMEIDLTSAELLRTNLSSERR